MHADEEGLPSPLPGINSNAVLHVCISYPCHDSTKPSRIYVGKLSSTEKDHVRIETSTSKKMEKVGQIMSGMQHPLHPREKGSFPCHCFKFFLAIC